MELEWKSDAVFRGLGNRGWAKPQRWPTCLGLAFLWILQQLGWLDLLEESGGVGDMQTITKVVTVDDITQT